MEKELSRKTMHEALEEICDSILEDIKGDRGTTDSWVFVHTRLMSLEVKLIDLFASHIEETENEEWGDKKDIQSMLKEILGRIDDLFKKPDYQEYASDDYGWQYDKEIKNRFLSKFSNEGIIKIHGCEYVLSKTKHKYTLKKYIKPHTNVINWNNPEEVKEYKKAYAKKYNAEHKKNRNEYSKEYRQNNKESIRDYMREYRKKNPDATKEYSREYFKKWVQMHPDKVKEYQRKWRKKNPNYMKEYYKKKTETIYIE